MSKKLDMSVLPDGFLIENWEVVTLSGNRKWRVTYMNSLFRTYRSAPLYRPAINYWHFNDGAMVLPDGLVVEVVKTRNNNESRLDIGMTLEVNYFKGIPLTNSDDLRLFHEIFLGQQDADYIECHAIRVIGVTEEYADDGARYGMEVLEV